MAKNRFVAEVTFKEFINFILIKHRDQILNSLNPTVYIIVTYLAFTLCSKRTYVIKKGFFKTLAPDILIVIFLPTRLI